MERLIEITREEYLALGDAGVWVWADWGEVDHEHILKRNSDHTVVREWRNPRNYTRFFTKVSDDV